MNTPRSLTASDAKQYATLAATLPEMAFHPDQTDIPSPTEAHLLAIIGLLANYILETQ